MPSIGAPVAASAPTAGGVLAGTYPNPSYARTMITRTAADGKAPRDHTHNAEQITGTFPATAAPTSTSSNSNALARADDPRLTDTRTWDQYSLDAYPVPGQAPTWGGATYLVDFLPTTRPLADAGTAQKGGIRLTNHLRGTAAEPRVLWRGPRDGVTKIDSDGYINANFADSRITTYARLVMNHAGESGGSLATQYSFVDFTVILDYNTDYRPLPGQTFVLEASAVRFPEGNNPIGRVAFWYRNYVTMELTTTTFDVPLGKYLLLTAYYSAQADRWVLLDSALEA